MAPVLPGFLFNPTDARFIGTPVVYSILDGFNGVYMRRTRRSGFFHGCIKRKRQPYTNAEGIRKCRREGNRQAGPENLGRVIEFTSSVQIKVIYESPFRKKYGLE